MLRGVQKGTGLSKSSVDCAALGRGVKAPVLSVEGAFQVIVVAEFAYVLLFKEALNLHLSTNSK